MRLHQQFGGRTTLPWGIRLLYRGGIAVPTGECGVLRTQTHWGAIDWATLILPAYTFGASASNVIVAL
jgi:hypothetical protein